jgi:hypothetical protein
MSYVIAAPEMLTAASADLEGIRSVLSAANAAAPTSGVLPAGAREDLGGVGVAAFRTRRVSSRAERSGGENPGLSKQSRRAVGLLPLNGIG